MYYAIVDRDWEGARHFLLGLVLCAAAAVLLLVSFGGGSSPGGPSRAVTPVGAPAPPPIAVRREQAGRSFAVAGASFRVLSEPDRAWAGDVDRLAAGGGQRLLAVAVEVVNHSRRDFDPGLLSYLLRGAGGVLLAPLRAGAVGPNALARGGGLPRGASAEERLVFAVPSGVRRPLLAIQPAPTRPLEIRVPLGAGR